MQEKPEWLRVAPRDGDGYVRLKSLFAELDLHTVCEEAHCPNTGECWGGGTATLMLMGDVCSRACRFCMVRPGRPAGVLDGAEPANVALALSQMDLNYVVLTSVDRDDLPDGGAAHFAETIHRVREMSPGILVEVLLPDFQNDVDSIRTVVEARPDVIAHNIETTLFLTDTVRDPRAGYWQSLSVLRNVKKLDKRMFTKSSIMLGLGEREEEVRLTMTHLRGVGVDFLTIGQYLRPSKRHLEVVEYVSPEVFYHYRLIGEQMGFRYVASGPLVRSSYRAGEFFMKSIVESRKTISEVRS